MFSAICRARASVATCSVNSVGIAKRLSSMKA
jgi:hypothetical protein